MGDEQQRKRPAVYGGWRTCETLKDVEEQARLADRRAGRDPGMVDRSDVATIAREMLKMMRRPIECHGER